VCDQGAEASGSSCVESVGLPTEFRENFETGSLLSPSRWAVGLGGILSGTVASPLSGTVVSSGRSLYFAQLGVSRRLVTVDLDLRNAQFVEFALYISPFYFTGVGYVTLSYSVTGGTSWTSLNLLGSSQTLGSSTLFVVPLPQQARVLGCRLQWWQPVISGFVGYDYWVSFRVN
jgi:reelin